MKTFILSHKIIFGIIIIGLAIGAYFIFRNNASGETRYVTQTVEKGSIATTVTGTGQVEASDTITLSPKTSGTINYVGVKVGQAVSKGKLIASVDSHDAKVALENAQISLEKLIGDPDSLSLLQKQNSVTKSYNDGWNEVSSFITDSNTIVNDINDIYGNDGYLGYKSTTNVSSAVKNKLDIAKNDYYEAKNSIDDITKLYKSLSRASSQSDIKNIINKSYDSAKVLANAVKDTETAFNAVADYRDSLNSESENATRTDINSWLDSSNNYVASLLSSKNSINESEQSLADLLEGADDLDIRSAKLTVEDKQEAYNDAFVYAPFDGIIATLTAKIGESSGSSIGTLITNQKLATVSLNEVDIAKIELGQKVNLTFDAVEDLNITGKVAEIDSIGTVSQGVVSYNIKISFDVDDERIKPGMSVSASIITETVQDVIVVPNTSVKTQNGGSYVEIFSSPLPTVVGVQGSTSSVLPERINVTTGLVDDTNTEIISGLNAGDIIVTKTIITTTTTTSKTSTPSILNAVGGGGKGAAGGATNRVMIGG